MDRTTAQRHATDFLYPPTTPFDQRMIDVGDGHLIYVEQSGNPDGVPVVVVHGGPGGGTSPAMRRFFDPRYWRVILFDQRGAGLSRPLAAVQDNTTWHLVADMERIRRDLGVERWALFGGSWGATLSLVYAISHPERVAHLFLRGVFLMERAELEWFYGGGAARFFPDLWARFEGAIPEDERRCLITAYHRRLFCGNYAQEVHFARFWEAWENSLASIWHHGPPPEGRAEYSRTFARIENHYFHHGGFLEQDGWILANRTRIEHLTATIVQGRYDMICPPDAAFRLAKGWSRADLQMVGLAGHALSEPAIAEALVRATDARRRPL